MAKVAYLGPKGTFTEKISKEIFSNDEFIAMQPIRAIVRAVESGEAEYGVLPIENYYNGEVRETLDSLTESDNVRIIQEKSIVIEHCLGVLLGNDNIKKIVSKDQALEQCSKYLLEKYPDCETIAVNSTSEAAKRIVEEKMQDSAAIGSEEGLKKAGLEIIDKNICPNNKTRFIVISKKETEKTGDDKTFVAIHPNTDKPGVLFNILSFLAGLEVNLEYIQSRPNGEKGYYFYLELDGHEKDERVSKAIDAIKFSLDPEKKYDKTIQVLGSFPNTHWKD